MDNKNLSTVVIVELVIAIISILVIPLYLLITYELDKLEENIELDYNKAYDSGYHDGYTAAKHNLSYGMVWEPFNFSCAEEKRLKGIKEYDDCIEKE